MWGSAERRVLRSSVSVDADEFWHRFRVACTGLLLVGAVAWLVRVAALSVSYLLSF